MIKFSKYFSIISIILMVCSFCLWSFVFADEPNIPTAPSDKKIEVPKFGKCPKTQIVGDVFSCMQCHAVGDFRLKETKPDAHLVYPNSKTKIIFDGDKKIGFFIIDSISSDYFSDAISYFAHHGINEIIMEINSPGGSMFGAWRIVGLMNQWKKDGGTISTHVHGLAASAGFLIFVSGTPGQRFVSHTSELMWHEVITFKMFDVTTPSDKEEESRVLRHFQNNANNYLASVSNLTKDRIDDLIRKKEFWITGIEAVEFGFADGYLTK